MKKIKKILYVTTISGFLPQFEMNDVKIMQDMGYEIHYASNFNNQVYSFDKEKLVGQGIILHHIDIEKKPTKLAAAVRAVGQIKDIIENENITIVHCHNPMGGVCARIAAWRSSVKPYVIYTAHGLHFYKGAPLANWLMFYPAEKMLANLTDIIITINREDYMRVKKHFRLKKGGHVEKIHGVGVDIEKFRPRKEISAQVRKELNVPADAFHIVTAAELNRNKNQRVVIEAVAALQNKNIYYSICGSGGSRDELEKLIEERGLADRVRLLGFRTDMDRVLQSADVFAFPSQREGLGIASIEALSCGVPIIALDNRGTREYTIDGVNGIMCGKNDVELFKNAIEKLCDDENCRRYYARNSRLSVRMFAGDMTAADMKRIYEKADKAAV